jgi:Na+/melibiose symporter-like transporter
LLRPKDKHIVENAAPELDKDNVPPGQTSHLPARIKYLYGIGDISLIIKQQTMGLFTFYLYTTVLGLSGTTVGVVCSLSIFWDAFIDPYIGYLSDRARSRWGRRHFFLLIGTLTMGTTFWSYFSPPRNLSHGLLLLWFITSNLLIRTTTSLFGVPYYALGAELSQDYQERTSITAIRSAWALFGTLSTVTLSFLVFFPNYLQGVDPKLDYERYPALGLTFGLIMTLAGLIATFGSIGKRGSRGVSMETTQPEVLADFFLSFKTSLQNRFFRAIFLSTSLFFMGVVVNTLLANYYFTYYVHILDSKIITAFHLCFYVSALIGVPFWLKISRSVEKKVLYIVASSVLTALLLCAWALFGKGHFFGTGNYMPLIIGNGLAGFFASILWFMPASMVADITDLDTWTTGERREGSYFGLLSFGQQVAAGVALLLTGFLVDRYAGLIPSQALQSLATCNRIGILFGVIPSICCMCATLAILFYHINQQSVQKIQYHLK